MFKAFNHEYDIIESILDAYVDEEELVWGFEVEAKCKSKSDGTFPGTIKITTHECPSFSSRKGELTSWKNISGKMVKLSDDYGDEEPDVLVYVDEHVPLYAGEFRVEITGTNILLKLCGKCDSGWGESCLLIIEAPLIFKGILCGRSPKDVALKSISGFLNPQEFDFKKDRNGVSVLEPKSNIAT